MIVQVAVYDDDALYVDQADAMARRVESRFAESIFDEIETRQRSSQSEGDPPPSEDSLYLDPLIAKP